MSSFAILNSVSYDVPHPKSDHHVQLSLLLRALKHRRQGRMIKKDVRFIALTCRTLIGNLVLSLFSSFVIGCCASSSVIKY